MERPRTLVVYCHPHDEHSLKRFFKRENYNATVIVTEFVEKGTCLCDFEDPIKPRTLYPTLHRENDTSVILPHFYNKSVLYENCNVQVLENTETDDISIGYFREIEG